MKCPYCRKPTEFHLATPAEEPAIPRHIIWFTVGGIIVIGLGLLTLLLVLKHSEKLLEEKNAARRAQPHEPGIVQPANP